MKEVFKKIAAKAASSVCICKTCPTYRNQKEPRAYCVTGKSNIIVEGRGCVCPKCPIWELNKFEQIYYCKK